MAETGYLRSPGGASTDHEGAGGPMAGSGDPRVPGGRAAGQELFLSAINLWRDARGPIGVQQRSYQLPRRKMEISNRAICRPSRID